MKILLSSHFFHPSIGGTEVVSLLLASEFVRAGHQVRVVTYTAQPSSMDFPFTIERRPSPMTLLKSVAWCDVVFHNNISLRTAWPLLAVKRPWIIAHQTWISRVNGSLGWRDRFKRRLIRRAVNVGVSAAMAPALDQPMEVIGNPYQDAIYRKDSSARRDRDLIFVGRLVSDKGVDVLLEALLVLKTRGLRPQLTIVGGGPEEGNLRRQIARLGLEPQVALVGFQEPKEVAALLNQHRVLAVPSRWAEPFGLVALEGMACGCVVVGSEQGGLKEAIGPGGLTFPNGDAAALSAALEKLLRKDIETNINERLVREHLEKHRPATVARAYVSVMARARNRSLKAGTPAEDLG